MSRNRRGHDTAAQRSMGDFVSRAGSSNRVEISDDEDDEVEEINTVSIKMEKDVRLSRRSNIPEEFWSRPLYLQKLWHSATCIKGKMSSKLSLSLHSEKVDGQKAKTNEFVGDITKCLLLQCCFCILMFHKGFINCRCSFVAFFALWWNLRSDC